MRASVERPWALRMTGVALSRRNLRFLTTHQASLYPGIPHISGKWEEMVKTSRFVAGDPARSLAGVRVTQWMLRRTGWRDRKE
ncbi:hypothetical protein QFZ76_003933 [Streptomyces sp. V4I2]|nr:hypothetical protein [Streptomyces sp. V4I2]